MSMMVDHGSPALLEFSGPDAVRFLNGQVTQDVREAAGGKTALPSCVTDAKGKLQFRVWIAESPEGNLWVEAPLESAEALSQRLTRYLIADDVEVADLTGNFRLVHFIDQTPAPPAGVIVRESRRYGVTGTDWWFPVGSESIIPEGIDRLEGDALEDFRIRHGVPQWGRELVEGLLPPEAGLDATDISYRKGCYIGQEVISRIKYAGKVNKRLVKLDVPAACADDMRLLDADGNVAGEITSLSPISVDGQRAALAYLRRGTEAVFLGGQQLHAQ